MDNSFGSENEVVPIQREPSVFDIPDLLNLVADYCDDDSLSKLSRVPLQ